MSVLNRLTEGIQFRDVRKESNAMVDKWGRTGLLEGIGDDQLKINMSLLMENQAKELLREASTMAAGDVEGFAAVAFPIVRRVFAQTIANQLVSVQPMSLPSGLIFFIDFQKTNNRLDNEAGRSLYGGGRVGKEITGGVLVRDSGTLRYGEHGFYGLNNGYSSATGSVTGLTPVVYAAPFEVGNSESTDLHIRFDPDLASGSYATVVQTTLSAAQLGAISTDNLVHISASLAFHSGTTQVRRLSTINHETRVLRMVFHATATFGTLVNGDQALSLNYIAKDNFTNASALGAVVGASPWELETQAEIPEIDIKVDSIPVTAGTKKLKAKWSPELGQDINAYHNLDAEVELTSILSEQITLEIDQEILRDLIDGATAATYYWSRRPGKFVNREDGTDVSSGVNPPDFTGNVSEWYETLLEVVNDVSAEIHTKVLRGGANFIVTSPQVASILEFTAGFRASAQVDAATGTAGVIKVGQLSKKWDIYVDPYFYRNLLLVGRKGSGFLESGYVYSPYVPLQVTPTIFGPEDFVPRKGVMTRYAKKMVRPDHYGLVIVQDMMG